MRNPSIRTMLRGLGSALMLAALPAAAATITVNTLADESSVNGNCSLREAVQAANTNAPVDACAAGSPGLDTIVLPAGTIPLSVLLNVTDAATFRGAGRASTTIQPGVAGALNGPGVAGATISLEDLALTGYLNTTGTQAIVVTRADIVEYVNSSDGDITLVDATVTEYVVAADGTISITGSTVSGYVNSADGDIDIADSAIQSYVNSSGGAVSLTDSTVSGGEVSTVSGAITLMRAIVIGSDADGIVSQGNITLTDSAVMDSAQFGVIGGPGSIKLTRSLVSGSRSSGIFSYEGGIDVWNSTVSGNARGIVAESSLSAMSVYSSTVTLNGDDEGGGGIYTKGIVSLSNSIVAGNFGYDCDSPVNTGNYSMDSDGTCGLAGAGNLTTNPLLGPLANNGGPTRTHLPQAGSPAIDAGSSSCFDVDQRGFARPIDGNGDAIATCDMGAVEVTAVRPPQPRSAQPVPTMSQWALIAMAALLALATAVALRRRRVTPR